MHREAIAFLKAKLESHPLFKEQGLKLVLNEGSELLPGAETSHPHIDLVARIDRRFFGSRNGALKLLGLVEKHFPKHFSEHHLSSQFRESHFVVGKNYDDRQYDIGQGMKLTEEDWQDGKRDLQGIVLEHAFRHAVEALEKEPRFKGISYVVQPFSGTGMTVDTEKQGAHLDDVVKEMQYWPDLGLRIMLGDKEKLDDSVRRLKIHLKSHLTE